MATCLVMTQLFGDELLEVLSSTSKSPGEETPSSTQDSYPLPQLSQPQLHCRVKVVPKTVPSTFKSLSVALRQVVDKQTTLFPVKSTLDGLHLFTAEILELRRREFVTKRGYPECLLDQPAGDNSFSSQNVNGTPDATKTYVKKQLSSEQVPQKEHMVSIAGRNLNMSGKEKRGTIAGTEYVENNNDSLTRSTSPTTKRLKQEAERSNVGIGVTANKELDEKIDALLEDAKNNAHTGYPRYEFIPVFEKDATDAKPIGKTKTNPGCNFQLGAYWSGSACLSFFSMDKTNKNSEAIPEDWRIFSAPISCIRVCKIPSSRNSPFILQDTDDHASLQSADSLYLLVGLINGNLIVRDLYSRLYLRTVNVCSGIIIEVNVLNPCEPSSKNLDISLIHTSVSRRSPPEVLFLRLSPDRTDVLSMPNKETYHAVAMLQLDGCLSLTAGLRSDSELVLFLPTGHSQKPKVDQLRYIRVQLPRPYVISLSCGTVSLLPRSQFDSIGEELSNQLRLTAAENGNEIYLWIRAVSRNVTDELGAQNEKLFRVKLYPFPWKDAETENAGVAAYESGELSETCVTKRMNSASLMDWAETILRQRSVTRDRRRDEFVKLWQALPTRVEKLVVE
ncbi:unnamed protein product [Dicrocoelium dendriticum]|nr:unnamed protein product [Dicrocoelium dendriticum]